MAMRVRKCWRPVNKYLRYNNNTNKAILKKPIQRKKEWEVEFKRKEDALNKAYAERVTNKEIELNQREEMVFFNYVR